VPNLEPTRISRPRFRGLPILADEETRLLPFSFVLDRLRTARGYWLSTTRPDGSPHAMPLWGIWEDGVFLFDTHPRSQKMTNLHCDRRAVLHLESTEETVILEGEVDVDEEIGTEAEARFVEAYAAKYDFPAYCALVFRPKLAYAWINAEYRATVTRYELPRS
jgi:Pyridoxamine 5'-phosphate oxidase